MHGQFLQKVAGFSICWMQWTIYQHLILKWPNMYPTVGNILYMDHRHLPQNGQFLVGKYTMGCIWVASFPGITHLETFDPHVGFIKWEYPKTTGVNTQLVYPHSRKHPKMMINVRGTPQAAACWKKNLLRVVPLVAQSGISWGFNGD